MKLPHLFSVMASLAGWWLLTPPRTCSAQTIARVKVLPDKAPDCSSLKSIVAPIMRDCKTNDEKVIANYNYCMLTNYHRAYPRMVFMSREVIAGAAVGDETTMNVDPLIFTAPKSSPVFREPLKGDDWTKRFSAAKDQLGDLELRKTSTRAEAGSRVTRVHPDSQAAALGFVPGDVISEMDDEPIGQKDFATFRKDGDQQLTLVGVAGEARRFTVKSGSIGFNAVPVVYPEMVYLRKGVRQPEWDVFAAVGAATCLKDPALAETAWHHAFEAGYMADFLSDYCGAQIAWRYGRPEDAVAFCASLAARKDVPASLDIEHFSRQLALANFKVEQAITGRMNGDPGTPLDGDGALNNWLRGLVSFHQGLPEPQRFTKSPGEVASYVKTNLLKQMEPRLEGTDEAMNRYRREVSDFLAKQSDAFELKVESGHHQHIVQMPKVDDPDVELIFRTKLRLTDNISTRFANQCTIGLINCDDPQNANLNRIARQGGLLSIHIEPWGACFIKQGTNDGVPVQILSVAEEVADGKQFTLRLLHASGRDELWINRRRLLYLPSAESPQKIGFYMRCIGTTAEVRVDFTKLDPKLARSLQQSE